MALVASVSSRNFQSDVLESKQVTVVRFWAAWCGPCTRLKPVFDEIANELETEAAFGEIDIDIASEIAGALGIQSIPTHCRFQ